MDEDFDLHHQRLGILLVHDGKPGHRTQAEGLGIAMAMRRNALAYEWNAESLDPLPEMEDPPKLVVSVGRHAARQALKIARALGVPAVALMNPGWWLRRRFDLCVVPRHDRLAPGPKLLLTDGVLNAMPVCEQADPLQGLLLVGGPSKHHGWDGPLLARQIERILERDPAIRWHATSSRRTPPATEALLEQMTHRAGDRLQFTPASETPRGWVAQQLHHRGTVWASADSVSMVYESLSAGAAVGILEVPEKRRWFGTSRVVSGVNDLLARGLATSYRDFEGGAALKRGQPLREADRVVEAILERWKTL